MLDRRPGRRQTRNHCRHQMRPGHQHDQVDLGMAQGALSLKGLPPCAAPPHPEHRPRVPRQFASPCSTTWC